MSQFAGPPPKDPPPEDWPALYEAGATTTQIAAWTGHTLVRVVQHLRAAGVVLRPRGWPRKPGAGISDQRHGHIRAVTAHREDCGDEISVTVQPDTRTAEVIERDGPAPETQLG
jgi:hypothetical protein